jgi:hypothetical protein
MALGSTLPLTEMSTRNLPGGKARQAGAWGWHPYSPQWVDCLENVGASTSHTPKGLHGLLQGQHLSVLVPYCDLISPLPGSVNLFILYLRFRWGKVVLVLNKLSTTSRTRKGRGGIAPPFFTLALDGGEWSASRPGRFTRGVGVLAYLSVGTTLLWPCRLRRLDADFPPRRPGFHSKSGHVAFLMEKVLLQWTFSEYLRFPYQFSSLQLLHIH